MAERTFRRRVSKGCLGCLLVTGIFLLGCDSDANRAASARGGRTGRGISQAIVRSLLKTMDSSNFWVRRRAVLELASVLNSRPVVLEAFLKHLTTAEETWDFDSQVMRYALGSAEGASARKVIEAYRQGNLRVRENIRFCIGRMGSEARGAAPLLREELGAQEPGSRAAAELRVVLAAVGQATAAEKARIAQDIAKGGEAPQFLVGGEPAEWTLATMYMVGNNDWVDDSTLELIVSALDFRSEGCRVYAAMVLGTLRGRVDKTVVDALRRVYERALRAPEENPESVESIPAGWSLAFLDRSTRKETLRVVLRLHRDYANLPTRSLRQWVGITASDELVADVVLLLKDPDWIVASQAAVMIQDIGPRARTARYELLRIAQSAAPSGDEFGELRREAIKALGMVGSRAEVKALESLRQVARELDDFDMEEALDECITVIRLAAR